MLTAFAALFLPAPQQGNYIQNGTKEQKHGAADHSGVGGIQHGSNIFQLRDPVVIQKLAKQSCGAAGTAEGAANEAASDLNTVKGKHKGSNSQKQTEKIQRKDLLSF